MKVNISKMVDYHRECGKHSGIPECCIKWFIGPWSNIRAHSWAWALYWRQNSKDNPSYIRCLTCIKNGVVVEIKECDCEV